MFGPRTWVDWFAALPRFHGIVASQGLLDTAITPYAKLTALGLNGAWAYLLAPAVLWGVWTAFRRDAAWPDQLIALLGGALLISPYAMNYELALLAPAVAAYVARTQDRQWLAYAAAAALYGLNISAGSLSLIAALILPVLGRDLQFTSVFFGAGRRQRGHAHAVLDQRLDLGRRGLAVDAALFGLALVDGARLLGEGVADIVEIILHVAADLAHGRHHHLAHLRIDGRRGALRLRARHGWSHDLLGDARATRTADIRRGPARPGRHSPTTSRTSLRTHGPRRTEART